MNQNFIHKKFIHKTACRICDGTDLVEILDLGEMPPANAFLRKEDLGNPEQKFPLTVYFCENCGLLKLLDVVNPEILFGRYDYLTSASKPLAEHFVNMAMELKERFLKRDDLIVEIGGNDGTLLSVLAGNFRVLNVEPAENIAELSRQKGIDTISDFFSRKLAKKIVEERGKAKVAVANNVMAHVDNVKDVFEGIKILIGEDGVFVFEVHWVGNLIGEGGFDQIYHEHLCYYSLTALRRLVEETGLEIFDVELVPIHGESMRVFVGKNQSISENVGEFLRKEKKLGLKKRETFLKFAEKVEKNKNELLEFLLKLKKEEKKIIGYGAPAKGNTLLNYFGIGTNILDFLIDTTSLKQGMYSPGMRVPICHPDKLNEEKPDYVLLLAWNYADAILEKEKELRKRGVKFIIPVPETRIV